MKVKISDKYQVVIPKAARKTMRLSKSGGYMKITKVTPTEITFARVMPDEGVMQYAGILKNEKTAWSEQGKDAAEWLREMRDKEWD